MNSSVSPRPSVNPGMWLFEQRWVAWMYEPELQRQLPLPYRLFAAYCASQRHFVKSRRIKLGQPVFRAMTRLADVLALPKSLHLELPDCTVFLNLRDPRFIRVVHELTNPQEETAVLSAFLAPGDTFIDVGANHGSYAIKAAKLLGSEGQIIAIEPQPELAELVQRSLSHNATCPFEVHPWACSNQVGMATIFIPQDTSGSAGLFPEFSATHAHRQVQVPLRRLDQALPWQHLPGRLCLKLDVEGSEYNVLEGARQLILARQPTLLMEVNPLSSQAAGVSDLSLIEQLQSLGYREYVEINQLDQRRPLAQLDVRKGRNIVVVPSEPA